jgi:hypothetical protein
VTTQDLTRLIDEYRLGLEAEIAILRQLEEVADQQHAASEARDVEALGRAADERDRLMAALVTVEQQIRPVRQSLTEVKHQVRDLPGYREALTSTGPPSRSSAASCGPIRRRSKHSLRLNWPDATWRARWSRVKPRSRPIGA